MWSDGLEGTGRPGTLPPEIRQFEMPVFEGDFFEPPSGPGETEEPQTGEPAKDNAVEISSRIEELEREAFEKGYKTGEEAGYAMGEQKAQVLVERLETIIEELSCLKDGIVKEMEPQFVELAMSAARQIVVEELTINQEAAARITKEAISKMLPQQRITIRTSPFVCDIISKHNPGLLQGGNGDIVIEADPKADRHGCVIAGPLQEIDTCLDEQLKNMIKQMSEKLGQTAGKNKNKSVLSSGR
ncbi:MAG: FliH/SctL family protein [Nitrospiraceae bacterium]|nr:FliH/SctL family protein [Nitrospiraceae bacterium]